jgi:hypothetical protein
MDAASSKMPPDKAPDPDGFDGFFLKKCWPIVKESFYKLHEDFYRECEQFLYYFDSKMLEPREINDYRPISLTNYCWKFITKIAVDRLEEVTMQCIHNN